VNGGHGPPYCHTIAISCLADRRCHPSSGYFVQPLWGCKTFVNFTTGFGLRPIPAAIIVMTPSGSGKEKWRARTGLRD
ncbi:MAG: hypothetical protein KAT56_07765, partial [Sedimentisphaerales bacterium]|nr:hypothetical protein [Sedimentisphaerales bacterium]